MSDEDLDRGGAGYDDVRTSLPHDIENDLRQMAKGKDEGLAKVSTAMLAWVHSNDQDRRQRNRLIAVVIVGILFVVGQNVQSYFQRQDFAAGQDRAEQTAADAKAAATEAKTLAMKIKECIGEDVNTPCRQQQAKNTTPVVGLLQKSIDCQALRREGSRPEPCAGVNERTDQLEAGIDPFPSIPSPTTTTPGAP